MLPLKDSYASLQRYHIKLLHDFESLLANHVQLNLCRSKFQILTQLRSTNF